MGLCGGLRCEELLHLKFKNVKDENTQFIVSIFRTKTNHHQQFVVGELFYNIVKKYIQLRPPEHFTERFFVQYRNGKCISQHIGENTIGDTPKIIATFLTLEDADRYTGHCFRRSAATLLSGSGASMQLVKQMGGWRSDSVAQLYIDHSTHTRQKVYQGIIHEAKSSTCDVSTTVDANNVKPLVEPSTNNVNADRTASSSSKICSIVNPTKIDDHTESSSTITNGNNKVKMNQSTESSNFQLQWDDFCDNFEVESASGKNIRYYYSLLLLQK